MSETITREQARAAYEGSGLAEKPLTFERLTSLRGFINKEMLAAALMERTCHMKHPAEMRMLRSDTAELRCRSYYFEDREAVTFNSNGFVGFAGWADEKNVQPILRGFMAWIEAELMAEAEDAA